MDLIIVDRGQGKGPLAVDPNLIAEVKGLAEGWQNKWSDAKVAKTIGRALPKELKSKHCICLHLPGGTQVFIPVIAGEQVVNPHPEIEGHDVTVSTWTLTRNLNKKIKTC